MATGQAELDLPDPLERTEPAPAGGGSGSAPTEDDLLAQLAGDEIDRLLADADVAKPSTQGNVTSPIVEDRQTSGQPSAATTSPIEPEPAGIVAADADGPIAPQDVEAELNAQLEDLFKTIDKPAEPVAPVDETPSASQGSAAQLATVADEPDASSVAKPLTSVPAANASAQVQSVSVELKLDQLPPARNSGVVGVLLLPLKLLSLPVLGASESTRATIGKLAILTLFNAIAVIVYVLLFRPR